MEEESSNPQLSFQDNNSIGDHFRAVGRLSEVLFHADVTIILLNNFPSIGANCPRPSTDDE